MYCESRTSQQPHRTPLSSQMTTAWERHLVRGQSCVHSAKELRVLHHRAVRGGVGQLGHLSLVPEERHVRLLDHVHVGCGDAVRLTTALEKHMHREQHVLYEPFAAPAYTAIQKLRIVTLGRGTRYQYHITTTHALTPPF